MHHLDEDFQIGYAIHDELKSQAILWFMGDVDTDDDDLSSDDDDDSPLNKGESSETPSECQNQ